MRRLIPVVLLVLAACSRAMSSNDAVSGDATVTQRSEMVTLANTFLAAARTNDTGRVRSLSTDGSTLEWIAGVRSNRPALLAATDRQLRLVNASVLDSATGSLLAEFDVPVKTLRAECYPAGRTDRLQFEFQREGGALKVRSITTPLC